MADIEFQRQYSSFINTNYSVAPVKTGTAQDSQSENTGLPSFGEILKQQLSKQQTLVFSKHAQQRLDSRQIEVTPQMLSKMSSAVESAREKGIQDALILQNQTAFIVNVPSSTVVTALSGSEMSSHIFTNIDGAVIV